MLSMWGFGLGITALIGTAVYDSSIAEPRRRKRYFDRHWQRFKDLNPEFTKDSGYISGIMGLPMTFRHIEFRPWGASSIKNAHERSIRDLERMVEEAHFQQATTKRTDSGDLIAAQDQLLLEIVPDHLKKNHPDVYERIVDQLARYQQRPDQQTFSFNESIYALCDTSASNRFWTRFKLFERMKKVARKEASTIDLSDLAGDQYDSVSGTIAYSRTINHPDYTLTRTNDELFTRAHEEGLFDGFDNPMVVSLFSGTSFIEMSWLYSLLREGTLDGFGVAFADAASTALTLHEWLDPSRANGPQGQRNKIYLDGRLDMEELTQVLTDWKDDVFLLKNNGSTCQPPHETIAELEGLVPTLEGKPAQVFYTIPTTTNSTGPKIYASENDHFIYDFLANIMLVPKKDQPNFTPICEEVPIGNDSFYYEIGFRVNTETKMWNQCEDKSVALKPETRLVLHKSYRYGEQDIAQIQQKTGLSVLRHPSGEAVALYLSQNKN